MLCYAFILLGAFLRGSPAKSLDKVEMERENTSACNIIAKGQIAAYGFRSLSRAGEGLCPSYALPLRFRFESDTPEPLCAEWKFPDGKHS
jgi:hypothetical protein